MFPGSRNAFSRPTATPLPQTSHSTLLATGRSLTDDGGYSGMVLAPKTGNFSLFVVRQSAPPKLFPDDLVGLQLRSLHDQHQQLPPLAQQLAAH
jgi:hypothetical protein